MSHMCINFGKKLVKFEKFDLSSTEGKYIIKNKKYI
jgi:hypothetical protein